MNAHRAFLVSAHTAAIKSLRDGDIEGYRYQMHIIIESSKMLSSENENSPADTGL